MSDRLEKNEDEDEWRIYSEPVTEDMLMCMKTSHKRLEA